MYPYRYCILLYDALINLKVPAPRVLSLSSSLALQNIRGKAFGEVFTSGNANRWYKNSSMA